MNIYSLNISGHYIGGVIVVSAKNKQQACKLIQREMDSDGLKNEIFYMDDIEKLDTRKPSVLVFINGDY